MARERSDHCRDCGMQVLGTGPGTLREYYMVHDTVWCEAHGVPHEPNRQADVYGGMLCTGCLAKRLGRPLTRRDFTDCPVNAGCFGFDITRFAA